MTTTPTTTNEKQLSHSSSRRTSVQRTRTEFVYDEICAKLSPKFETPGFQGQFLSLGHLESILSEEVVNEILVETFLQPQIQGVQLCPIWGRRDAKRRMKILATLILIGEVKYIEYFCQQGLFHEHLPLSNPGHAAFRKWKRQLVDQFRDKQHVLLPHRFTFGENNHDQLDPGKRLPFLNLLHWTKGGAHGMVSQVRIHHDDHSGGDAHLDSADKTCLYAVKKFIYKTDFDNERRGLARFSSPNNGHKHIIQLLGSYEVGSEYFMIFHWANGNLSEFWKRQPSYTNKSGQGSYWLIKQCRGVADALFKIHKHTTWKGADRQDRGRHGDIKPENILFFEGPQPGYGFLTIADFTLMRFHSLETVDKTAPKDIGYSKIYRPPEVKKGQEASSNQKHDVWSLGCVYLEFITWYLMGYHAIRGTCFETPNGDKFETFSTSRTNDDGRYHQIPDDRFFQRVEKSAKVKDSVKKWIKMLHKNEHCSQAMHEFLDLIEDRMLVAQYKDRGLMLEVLTGLSQILSRCDNNDSYCYRGNPSPSLPSECLPRLYDDKNQVSKNVAKATIRVTRSFMNEKPNPDIDLLRDTFLPKVSSKGGKSLSNSHGESDGHDLPSLPNNTNDLQIGVEGVRAEHDDMPPGTPQVRPHKRGRAQSPGGPPDIKKKGAAKPQRDLDHLI